MTDRKSNFNDVQAFHDKFGISDHCPDAPQNLPKHLVKFRLAFLLEELSEFARAQGALATALRLNVIAHDLHTMRDEKFQEHHINTVDAFDALLDLSVVTLGTADMMGLPWEAGWDIVHERNMAKVRANADGSNSKRRSPYDIVKPPGWYGPEKALTELLATHMHRAGGDE